MIRSRVIRLWAAVILSLIVYSVVEAQHQGHQMPPTPAATPKASPSATPSNQPTPVTPKMPGEPGMPAMTEHPATQTNQPANASQPASDMDSMNMGELVVVQNDEMFVRVGNSRSNLIPMGRMGSGTSWQPASSRMNMLHKQSGDWLVMFHYNLVADVNSQGGTRGTTKVESANWFMPAALRRVGIGLLELRGMFSFEPFTFPPGGSPLLFQTGETYKGQPLIDRQHPHDMFMELSATYTVPLGDHATWFAYAGYPGEPALGPTAFMHRASASENSSAPLGHHLQDSSHISFGVVTSGVTYRWLKLEGSVFNGREPDEHRYNFEAHPWNSRSIRLSIAPTSNWSIQVSHGLLKNPEELEPGDVRRTTASLSYNRPFARGSWATSLIWGRNHESHSGETVNLNSYLAESTVNFLDRNYLYTRLELVDKNQLLRPSDRLRLGITEDHPSFRIGAYTFGGARDIWETAKAALAIGSDVTFYSKPSILDSVYGNNPVSWKLFFRIRPGKMTMHTH